MKFFFPDSQDTVGSAFDFDTERHRADRVRQRHDLYAHEVFSPPPMDGLLVSKAIVDGLEGAGKYTFPQRLRIRREGVKDFLRLTQLGKELPVIGDCGAFSYVRQSVPPPDFSVDSVLQFYDDCRFDFGISVDHVILDYKEAWDVFPDQVPKHVGFRRELTLELARQFLSEHRRRGCRFTPMGTAQGWSPRSYAESVQSLVRMGYRYIALGGMVPLKSAEILKCLAVINDLPQLPSDLRFHLLGVTRIEHLASFQRFRVASFDSTSPLVMAFKDEKENYYTPGHSHAAIRIPQVDANPTLSRRIKMGVVSQDKARTLERRALQAMKDYDAGSLDLEGTLAVLAEYEELVDPNRVSKHLDRYRVTLEAQPWKDCPCAICQALGYHVILFRGAERNRSRGFHNLFAFYRRLQAQLTQARNVAEDILPVQLALDSPSPSP